MKRYAFVAFSLIFGLLAVRGVHAQDDLSDEHQEIYETVRTFFRGFATQDSTLMKSVAEPDARLVITSFDDEDNPRMQTLPVISLIRTLTRRQGAPIVETIWNPQIMSHDNLATVWVNYNLWVDDKIDHCGKDAFQLARTRDGWKIVAVADTQRKTGCESQGLLE